MPPSQNKTKVTLSQILDQAVAHHQKDELDEAQQLYLAFLSKAPQNPHGWTNYGALLRKRGLHMPAVSAHLRALDLAPGMENALNNLANAYNDVGNFTASIEIRSKHLEEEPGCLTRLRDLVVALRGDWQHEKVIELVDKAEQTQDLSEHGELLLQRALSLLMLGRYAEGFRDFEGRYDGTEVSLPEGVPFPRWMGEDIFGKKLLIIPEQGYGDAILMARFLPRLIEMGAEVSMITKPPLQRLFEGLADHWGDRLKIISYARKSDPFDFYTPNMSLPHLVGMKADDTPPPPPIVTVPAKSRGRARAMVKPFDDRFKIGVVWTGSMTYKANHRRSCGPEAFLPIAEVPGVQLFSLYKGDGHTAFLASGMNGLIQDACGTDEDFADTAAIIDEMDLMITTDTAVVHVAGSMGRPVWNLLAHEGFWLYGAGETTPWYPGMRLFRQREVGNWDELFARVTVELQSHMAAQT